MKSEKKPSKPKSSLPKAVKPKARNRKELVQAMESQDNDIQEAIRVKAYELYLERGCVDGHDVEDWKTAESIILKKMSG